MTDQLAHRAYRVTLALLASRERRAHPEYRGILESQVRKVLKVLKVLKVQPVRLASLDSRVRPVRMAPMGRRALR